MEKREEDIKQGFEGTEITFHHPEDLSDFNVFIVNDDDLNKSILEEKKNSANFLSWTTSQVLLTGPLNLVAF